MAPETIAQGITSHQSDLFAFGVIAYELLTGQHPYMTASGDPMEVNSRVQEETPQPPSTINGQIDNTLDEIVLALLERDAGKRPQSAFAVCEMLRDAGATYPFERCFLPRHFFTPETTYDGFTARHLSLNEDMTPRLDCLTGGDVKRLQMILDGNAYRGNLVYREGQFVFEKGIYWPQRARRIVLRGFCRQSLSEKKRLIRQAVATVGGSFATTEASPESRPVVHLLLPLLSAKTVRRIAAVAAREVERAEEMPRATRLYLMAGELEAAERCAYQAAVGLHGQSRSREALRLLKAVLDYGRMRQDEFILRQLHMTAGDIHKDLGELNEAEAHYKAIIALSAEHPVDKLLAETYKDFGGLHRQRREFEKGLEAHRHALALFESLNDELEISHTHVNIGNIYWELKDLSSALKEFRLAFHMQRRLGALADAAASLNNIASVYFTRGRHSRCISLLNRALELNKRTGNEREIARTLNNLGYLYHYVGEQAYAADSLTESLTLTKRFGTKKDLLFNLENLSKVLVSAGRLDKALAVSEEGMTIAARLDDEPHLAAFALIRGTIFKRQGKVSSAQEEFARCSGYNTRKNDTDMACGLLVQDASLRHFLGRSDEALEIAERALRLAEEAQSPLIELDVLLLLSRLKRDESVVERTRALIQETHRFSENLVLTCNLLEQAVKSGHFDNLTPEQRAGFPQLPDGEDNIELPRLCTVLARVAIAKDDINSAENFIARANRLATAFGLTPELIELSALYADLEARRGNFEQSYSSFREGLALAKKVAMSICDEADQRVFLRSEMILSLTEGITKLNGILNKKESR
ncbi:MAG: hypothetical protein D6800_14350 [Candidatus Zixiibacteriota bacterium]|nr:MAG: hypothetical protein D6800_14350 [candidate division Zixibacteria bacterium]